MSNMDERPIAAMVCGPKGAGKSTFCKLLVNALVSRGATPHQSGGRALGGSVAFLDLDPGQPEYSPPGELSLFKLQSCNFGPSFTHPTIKSESDQLVRAHYFGHISPKDDPCHYYKCALDLFDHYQRISTTSYASLPLIVNSSGWIQGNGLKLLADLIKGFLLTDVIYMSTSGPGEVIGVLAEATNRVNIQFHQLASQASEASTKSAADLRMMQTLSYFHLDLSDEDNKELRWDPWPITRRAPLVVHYAGIQQGISAVMVLGDEQKSEFMESILDGCLVGLVATEAGIGKDPQEIPQSDREATHANGSQRIEDVRETPSIIRTATGVPYIVSAHHTSIPLSPEGSRCIGQALIRGIDTKTKTFQLLTSVSVGVILACCPNIVLVRGNLDTPTWAYREDFELAQAQRRLRSRILGVDEDFGKLEMQNWAVKQPWADVVDGGRKNSGKVRRIRRDIKYKPQAGDITV